MKQLKLLAVLSAALCVPGAALRALHFLNGFDTQTGLPVSGSAWAWYCIALFVLCGAAYAAPPPERPNHAVPKAPGKPSFRGLPSAPRKNIGGD